MIETGTFLQQRYRIDKQIGQGGMGAVYIATDERFGSMVAIKETLCMDDSFRKAIEREARLLNSLKHSALPRVSDHFEENNGQFLVMEYIEGEDLCCVLDQRGEPFAVDQVMHWADKLLDALSYLHNQSVPVIHRDIKPQNLKLTPRGEIILLDFGLAKGNPTDAGHQTAAKSIFGYSRNYASLEQIQGTGTDPRSDLYSLAATLYHLLTNTVPEDALTRAMSVLSQKGDPLLPACEINPAIPRGVAGVLQKALDLNADERPASAAELRQMFKESDFYAAFAESKTVAAAPGTNILAQKTRLMPEATAGPSERNIETDMRAAALSSGSSGPYAASASEVETQLSAAKQTSVPKKKFGVAAAGALALLIGGGAVAGGIYVLKPSAFGLETPETENTIENVTVGAPASNATNATSTTNSDTRHTSSESAGQIAEPPRTEDQPATTAQDKNAKTDTAKKNKGADTGLTLVDEDGSTIQMPPAGKNGNVVITEKNPGGDTRVILKRGEYPSNMQWPPNVPPPGFDPRNLTPEQRRRLRNAMRNGTIRPGTPAPTPSMPQNRP